MPPPTGQRPFSAKIGQKKTEYALFAENDIIRLLFFFAATSGYIYIMRCFSPFGKGQTAFFCRFCKKILLYWQTPIFML